MIVRVIFCFRTTPVKIRPLNESYYYLHVYDVIISLPDADISGKWTFFVDIVSFAGVTWCFEAKSDVAYVALVVDASAAFLGVVADSWLSLECPFRLSSFG